MFYLTTSPWLLRKLYPSCLWQMPTMDKKIYLTFDDGPHPVATSFVLEQLERYQAKGTFFCIGKNVTAHPDIYQQILNAGHTTGNHTNNHLNGWKTHDQEYIDNIMAAQQVIDSPLFRPPYGRITRFQLAQLKNPLLNMQPVMWSVLSGDFDAGITADKCTENVVRSAGNGAIIVFHDSEKAWKHLSVVLPRILKHYSKKGFTFEKIGA